MTIYRHKKDGNLYLIYYCSPRMYTGEWYEAVPYFENKGKYKKSVSLKDFTIVSSK